MICYQGKHGYNIHIIILIFLLMLGGILMLILLLIRKSIYNEVYHHGEIIENTNI